MKGIRSGASLFARRVIGSLHAQLDRQTQELLTFCGESESQQNGGVPTLSLVKLNSNIFLGRMDSLLFVKFIIVVLPIFIISPNISRDFLEGNAIKVFFKELVIIMLIKYFPSSKPPTFNLHIFM